MDKSTIITLVIAAIMLVAYAVILVLKKTKWGKNKKLEKAEAIALKLLKSVGLALVTEAERAYGSGTGVLKLSSVINEVLKLLPAWVTELINTDWLTNEIEQILNTAKIKWEANPKLLEKTE